MASSTDKLRAMNRVRMMGESVPELWSKKIMGDLMRDTVLAGLRNREYSNGIRGTYERERDEAYVGRIIIRDTGRRLKDEV